MSIWQQHLYFKCLISVWRETDLRHIVALFQRVSAHPFFGWINKSTDVNWYLKQSLFDGNNTATTGTVSMIIFLYERWPWLSGDKYEPRFDTGASGSGISMFRCQYDVEYIFRPLIANQKLHFMITASCGRHVWTVRRANVQLARKHTYHASVGGARNIISQNVLEFQFCLVLFSTMHQKKRV